MSRVSPASSAYVFKTNVTQRGQERNEPSFAGLVRVAR
jgi:hypothetical protein